MSLPNLPALALLATLCLASPLVSATATATDTPAETASRKDQLATSIAQADRIEILTPHPSSNQIPIATLAGPQRISQFLDSTEFSEEESGGHCMCYGDALLRFMQGDTTLATLSYHHSIRLRWNDGPWNGDSELTTASKEALPAWFYDQGFPHFYRASQSDLARKTRYQADLARFTSFFTEEQKQLITINFSQTEPDWLLNARNRDKAIVQRLLAQAPDKSQFATHCFLALGTPLRFNELSNNAIWWNVVNAAAAIPDSDFKRALENVHHDSWGLLGAREPFFRGGFHKRFSPEDRSYWTLKIADAVLSLAEDYEKDQILQSVANLRSTEGDDFLLHVARGTIGREIDYQHAGTYYGGIRATAYHFLSANAHKELETEIRAALATANFPGDLTLLKSALLRLGNLEYLSLDLYDSNDDTVQAAFLKAIEQSKHVEHIDLLVQLFEEKLSDTSERYVGSEALNAFGKATGFQLRSQSEIEEDGEEDWHPEDEHFQKAITWWQQNRQEFTP